MPLVLTKKSLSLAAILLSLVVGACSGPETLPTVPVVSKEEQDALPYRIGSDDSLSIFVWRNNELSTSVAVRPDGRITIPLIEDLPAVGKTPTELARDVEKQLAKYIQDPIVTIMVQRFVGPFGGAPAGVALPLYHDLAGCDDFGWRHYRIRGGKPGDHHPDHRWRAKDLSHLYRRSSAIG